jgi:hypothetical protein
LFVFVQYVESHCDIQEMGLNSSIARGTAAREAA